MRKIPFTPLPSMHFLIMCPFCQMEHFPLFASPSMVDLIWLIKKSPSYFLFSEKGGITSCVGFYNDYGV